MTKQKEINWSDAVRTKRKAEIGDSEFFYQLESEGCLVSVTPEVVSEAKKHNLKVVKKTVYLIYPNQSPN